MTLVVKNPPDNAGDVKDAGSIPGWGRSPGEGNEFSLQYSCLENPMDRGAWWATVHSVTKSWTRLKWLSTQSSVPGSICSHFLEASSQTCGSLLWTPGGGFVKPLQYSCLENPMDRGAWRATVHSVAKSRTWLKGLCTHMLWLQYGHHVVNFFHLLGVPVATRQFTGYGSEYYL